MSEIDVHGAVLSEFSDISSPYHMSSDSEGRVLVADFYNHRILLLNDQLQLQRVLVDTDSQLKLFWPKRLCYNKLTSHFYVLHSSEWLRRSYRHHCQRKYFMFLPSLHTQTGLEPFVAGTLTLIKTVLQNAPERVCILVTLFTFFACFKFLYVFYIYETY